ncbi:hormone-sensitive lipase-like [Mytilus californianus]|uniref:hormone-sensitive lipase-like n=1 Tax=Mytilus californianus TaxID=6549 RepID=UPI0022471473|nr:hormone-sensitive lipase-like [Mytilus californianus]
MFSTLLRDLRAHAISNIEYYQNGTTTSTSLFHKSFSLMHEHLDRGIQPSIEEITPRLADYDLSPDIHANGYRSLIKVVHKCCLHLLQLSRHISNNRTSMFFRGHHYSKELESYVSVLGQLRASLHYANKLIPFCDQGNLFANEAYLDNEVAENLLKDVERLSQDCFYGRCLGFQFCESMVKPLHGVGVAMASFSDGYKNESHLLQLTTALFNSGKYFLDPDLRAQRVVDVTRTADISFCKAFWSIPETDFMQLSHLACPRVHVNEVIAIQPGPFEMNCHKSVETVVITPPCAYTGPGNIKMRLFSNHWREGQKVPHTKMKKKPHPKSSGLVLHCHGGGFVAQSSRSHEVYLRQWAKDLDVPILSIDYSLAPEYPFPRALEECFYAYAWALENSELLGWTGERICFAGDSAGGNLMMATAIRAASFQIRVPDGIMAAYTPFMVRYTPSPSRMMGLMDPLLPMGILTRCLAAYAGVSTCFSPKDDKWVIVEYKKSDHSFEDSEKSTKGDNSPTDTSASSSRHNSAMDTLTSSSDMESNSGTESCFEEVEIDNGHVPPINEETTEKDEVKSEDSFEVLTVSKDALGTPDSTDSQFSVEDFVSEGTDHSTSQNVNVNNSEPNGAVMELSEGATTSNSVENGGVNEISHDSVVMSPVEDGGFDDQTFSKDILSQSNSDQSSNKHKKLARVSKGIPRQMSVDLPKEICQSVPPSQSMPYIQPQSRVRQTSRSKTFDCVGHSDSDSSFVTNCTGTLNFVPLRAAKHHIQHSPLTAFRHLPIVKNPYMSPLLASEELLKDLPPVYLVACHLDPLLDDSVSFAKKLRDLNKKVDLHLIDDLPHGFLNFSMVSKEARLASDICVSKIMSVLG